MSKTLFDGDNGVIVVVVVVVVVVIGANVTVDDVEGLMILVLLTVFDFRVFFFLPTAGVSGVFSVSTIVVSSVV